jgi:Na+-translocating ferredoxin:NAD+ oxidoreductase RNF subunit RnfB
VAISSKEKIREIYEVLPKLNCDFCGFGSCGQFARAVVEGGASPFGCRQNPWSGYRISEIIGVKIPAYAYGFQPAFVSRPGVSPSPQALREEVQGLWQSVDDILARIGNLKARRQDAKQRGR